MALADSMARMVNHRGSGPVDDPDDPDRDEADRDDADRDETDDDDPDSDEADEDEARREESQRKSRVAVLEKALDLLEALAAEPNLGLSELSDRTGVGKTSSYRVLNTLELRSFVAKDPTTRKYRPGAKLVALSATVVASLDILRLSRPFLESVHQQTGETVNLGVLDDDRVLYIDVIESSHGLRIFSSVGRRSLIHCTALGKALLCGLDPTDARRLIERVELPAKTRRTITHVEALVAEIAACRERGMAVDDEEDELGGRCIAAPIWGPDGVAVAALSVSGPVPRIGHDKVDEIGRVVKAAAAEISDLLRAVAADPAMRSVHSTSG